MWYNIDFKNDLIVIKNASSTDEVFATFQISESCSNSVFEEVIARNQIDFREEYKLPLRDGLYKIIMQRVVNTTIVETQEVLYPYYGNLLQSFIDDTEHFLCNCDCVTCDDDCNKDERTYASLLLKAFSYYTLMYKYYSRFYETVFKCLECDILDANKCLIINEQVTGNSDNDELFRKIISTFFLSFYYAEYYNNEDKGFVDSKYKTDKILKCLRSNNADIDCITNKIKNNMGNFDVTFDAYQNQPPSEVGDYSTNALNRAVMTLNIGQFTNLTTPAYADPENDSAQAIRIDTLPTNGAVLKLDGTNVTAGQIILATDITAGKLTLTGPNINELTATRFTFSVRDTGSMQFTS